MWHIVFTRGRHRGLRWWVIAVLSRGPKNGVEIMDEIEGLTMGWWRPSPGSIYPLLEELSREGLVRRREDGRYELTERGRQEAWPWAARLEPRTAGEVLDAMSTWITYLEDIKKTRPSELEAQKQRIRELAERLSRLAE